MKSNLSLGLACLALLALTACKEKPSTTEHAGHVHETQAGKELYQCAMHPNVVSDRPGNCPICGMELTLVKPIEAKGIPGRGPVQLTDQQTQLINIKTVPVTKGPLDQTIRAVGQVVVNEEKTAALNSRVMGWVEKLYVDTTGAPV
ncbi:MAG: heavy metal-binding domain-containing protein, partial [Chthoniobacterales bacterium]